MLSLGTSQAVITHNGKGVSNLDGNLDQDRMSLSFVPHVEHESGHLVVLVSHELNLLVAFGSVGFWQ